MKEGWIVLLVLRKQFIDIDGCENFSGQQQEITADLMAVVHHSESISYGGVCSALDYVYSQAGTSPFGPTPTSIQKQ